MLTPAIRFIAAQKAASAAVHLLCRVKPGTSADRQGITAVTEHNIDICVAAQARDGAANKAVKHVIAHTLNVPKSDVTITKGIKSREKTVTVNINTGGSSEDVIERIKSILLGSVSR